MGSKGKALGTLFLTLARSSKEAFFAPFAKNALRAAFVSGVSAFWKRRSHLALKPCKKLRIPKQVRFSFY
ncbi:MAG: hypothetical protein H7834_00335 [Magnetococcus sp. YQC-9]